MPATTFDSAPIRTAIKAKIAGVANAGQVHNRERWPRSGSALKALYESRARRAATASTAGSCRSAPSARLPRHRPGDHRLDLEARRLHEPRRRRRDRAPPRCAGRARARRLPERRHARRRGRHADHRRGRRHSAARRAGRRASTTCSSPASFAIARAARSSRATTSPISKGEIPNHAVRQTPRQERHLHRQQGRHALAATPDKDGYVTIGEQKLHRPVTKPHEDGDAPRNAKGERTDRGATSRRPPPQRAARAGDHAALGGGGRGAGGGPKKTEKKESK
jgi:hypothetical protein